MLQESNYMGYDGFVWWVGVVEDRFDPLKLGRCRVRIAGAHTADKSLIPTVELPWAHPLMPLTDSSMLMFKEGDYVMGFYLDGPNAQHPVMMGILPGIPDRLLDKTVGFSDPRTDSELKESPRPPQKLQSTSGVGVKIIEFPNAQRYPNVINEPTISRVARNEQIKETIVQAKKDSVVKNAPTTYVRTFDEPPTPYYAKYPYNKVIETESGHLFEYDDTPGAERIHFYHRSGSFIEMHNDGTVVVKTSGAGYEFVLADKQIYVAGDCNITSSQNINIKAAKDIVMEANTIIMTANNSVKTYAGQNISGVAGNNIDLGALSSFITSGNSSVTLFSAGTVTIQGATTQINPGIIMIDPLLPSLLKPPQDVLDALTDESEQKLIALEGSEAPIDGGANANNAASLNSPINTPPIAALPKDSTIDTRPLPDAITPKTICEGVSLSGGSINYELQLSSHFKLKHLTNATIFQHQIPLGGQYGKTAEEIICNLKALAENILEPLLKQYPGFRINSAFRSEQSAGGKSQHPMGQAADIQWPGQSTKQLYEKAKWIKDNLPYDQLIFEYGESAWIHISFNRKGNRASSAPNKVCSYHPQGWPIVAGQPTPITPGGLYTKNLVLLANREKDTPGPGGIIFT